MNFVFQVQKEIVMSWGKYFYYGLFVYCGTVKLYIFSQLVGYKL